MSASSLTDRQVRGSNVRVKHNDLRELLELIEGIGELEVVEGADWNLEISALSELLCNAKAGRAPALLFDNIKGYPKGFRILSGTANSPRRLALSMGFPDPEKPLDLVQSYRDRMRSEFELKPPVQVERGPILENIDRDDAVDLLKFPVPFVHEKDGGRYIGTDDMVIMRDYDSDWVNAATYRSMICDRNTVGLWMSPGKHGRLIREKYFKAGKPCPVAIVVGQDPLMFFSANMEVDYATDELAHAGGHRGWPFEIIKSELHGLPIPAQAEIVLEGEILPDETFKEGPFGEFMGYYASPQHDEPKVRIRRVYHRNDPILTMAIPARPPMNYTYARGVVKAAMIWDEMEKCGLPGVKGVWCHEAGAGRMFNVVTIEQLYPGHSKQAGMLAANCHSGNYAGRWTIVVDHDIDPSDLFDVVWAMSTRCDPPEDIDYVRRCWSTPLDSMLKEPPFYSNRAVVDACRPWAWKDQFPAIAEASPELKAKIYKKYAHMFRD
jgi:UbiD family decarboxylase